MGPFRGTRRLQGPFGGSRGSKLLVASGRALSWNDTRNQECSQSRRGIKKLTHFYPCSTKGLTLTFAKVVKGKLPSLTLGPASLV